jgi:hypothetical protein
MTWRFKLISNQVVLSPMLEYVVVAGGEEEGVALERVAGGVAAAA